MRTVCLFVLLCVSALSYGAKKYKLVEISTNLGNIKIRLSEISKKVSRSTLDKIMVMVVRTVIMYRLPSTCKNALYRCLRVYNAFR